MQAFVNCSCNGSGSSASHQSYGIYRWNSTGAKPCSHVTWVTVEQGYDYFVQYAQNTKFSNMGGNVYFLKILGINMAPRCGKEFLQRGLTLGMCIKIFGNIGHFCANAQRRLQYAKKTTTGWEKI